MNEATIFLKQAVIIMCTQSTVILFSMDFPWKRRQVTGYPPTWWVHYTTLYIQHIDTAGSNAPKIEHYRYAFWYSRQTGLL